MTMSAAQVAPPGRGPINAGWERAAPGRRHGLGRTAGRVGGCRPVNTAAHEPAAYAAVRSPHDDREHR
jgi:hypothetical protein